MLAVVDRLRAEAVVVVAGGAGELVGEGGAWRAVVSILTVLWACSSQWRRTRSTVFRSIAIATSWALKAIVERLGVQEWRVGAWRAKRHVGSFGSFRTVAMVGACDNSAVGRSRMGVTMVALRTQIAVLCVVEVSSVGEGAGGAINLSG